MLSSRANATARVAERRFASGTAAPGSTAQRPAGITTGPRPLLVRRYCRSKIGGAPPSERATRTMPSAPSLAPNTSLPRSVARSSGGTGRPSMVNERTQLESGTSIGTPGADWKASTVVEPDSSAATGSAGPSGRTSR